MSNCPDDIRQYDNHPNSPFYEEPWLQCTECGEYYRPEEDHDDVCEDCYQESRE